MKIYKSKLFIFSFLLTLVITTISLQPVYSQPTGLAQNKIVVIDTTLDSKLPDNFRIITSLNISGSAQFTPSQLPNMINTINSKSITIVDLRQESHGFVNDTPISFYSVYELLNNGFNSEQSLAQDKADLSALTPSSNIQIFGRSSLPYTKITVDNTFTEETLCKNNNVNYIRFAVRDGGIPAPNIVDDFITFIKNLPSNTHLHFHCLHGEGRTTTFMVIYQIMNNSSKLSLDQILEQQLSAGGIVLTTDAARDDFLKAFYNYVEQNKTSNYNQKYEAWLKTF